MARMEMEKTVSSNLAGRLSDLMYWPRQSLRNSEVDLGSAPQAL
jgi:hypothetical protein